MLAHLFFLFLFTYGQTILHAKLIRIISYVLNCIFILVQFFTGFKADIVDNQMRMNMFPVAMRADQYLIILVIFGKF